MNVKIVFPSPKVFLPTMALFMGTFHVVAHAASNLVWGNAQNNMQMAAQINGVERLRELYHSGKISSIDTQSLHMDLSIRNDGAIPMIINETGSSIGISFYTFDDQRNRIDLTEPAPGGGTKGSLTADEIEPGETKLVESVFSLKLLRQVKNGLYAEMKFNDVNSTNYFELSTPDLKISNSVLSDLLNGPNWGPVTNGTQIAIEVQYVDNPNDYTATSIIPINVYVRAVGEQTVQALAGDVILNTVFVTQDGQGVNMDIKQVPPAGPRGITQIEPGKKAIFYTGLPVSSLNDIHGTVSVRVPLYYDFNTGESFPVESAPIDARLINDFINAVAPKLTPIPEANLNPLPTETTTTTSTSPGSSRGPSTVTAAKPAAPKPTAKPEPTVAQAESPSYTMPALIALGVLIVAGFFLRRRK